VHPAVSQLEQRAAHGAAQGFDGAHERLQDLAHRTAHRDHGQQAVLGLDAPRGVLCLGGVLGVEQHQLATVRGIGHAAQRHVQPAQAVAGGHGHAVGETTRGGEGAQRPAGRAAAAELHGQVAGRGTGVERAEGVHRGRIAVHGGAVFTVQ
jgi:hypothetical protein